jgi:hypothetical protein
MGLDVFVGSLTRYYAGNWETVIQQAGRQNNVPVQVIRPKAPSQGLLGSVRRLINRVRPEGVEAAARVVRRWQKRLRRDLHMPDLDWNEDPDAPYFTDKPAWDCYGALVLWAAYEELPDAKRRETAEGWEKDSTYLTNRINRNSRYQHLSADTETWLPVDFPNPIRTLDGTGNSIVLGSSVRLVAELRELNQRTWAAKDAEISQWRYDGAEYGAPLEISARFAFSIFFDLAGQSVARQLPMKLDY